MPRGNKGPDKDSTGANHSLKGARGSVLAQLKFPLVFFGLALITVEATFGGALIRHTYSDSVTITFGIIMGALFLCSVAAVAVLVYKVPSHIMLQPQETAKDVQAGEIAQAKRIRAATSALLDYSAQKQKDPKTFLAVLEKVESILSGTSLEAM